MAKRPPAGRSGKLSRGKISRATQEGLEPSGATEGSKPSGPDAAPSGRPSEVPRGLVPKGLIIVATPIGNLGDITLRALETLRHADVIACEDTRVSNKLLARYGIDRPLLPYHEHNAARQRPVLLERLRRGETVALVSDAGTPLVSDPGFKLVREARAAGLAVTTVPGPSAPLAALVISGLPSDRFLFGGFLPPRSAARRAEIAELATVPASLLFFESPARLAAALADMAAVLGPREAVVARELTKLFEEVRHGTLPELAAHYAESGPPKGEIVIVVAPPGPATATEIDLDAALQQALAGMSLRDAAAAVAAATGRPRREVYARALVLAETEGPAKGPGKAGR